MVKVTRLNKTEFWLNPHLIEFIEATPDTVISLSSNKKVIVSESVDEVIKRILKYRNKLNIEANQEH